MRAALSVSTITILCNPFPVRLYDPDEGAVSLDGVNLKELNVEWYRKQIGNFIVIS